MRFRHVLGTALALVAAVALFVGLGLDPGGGSGGGPSLAPGARGAPSASRDRRAREDALDRAIGRLFGAREVGPSEVEPSDEVLEAERAEVLRQLTGASRTPAQRRAAIGRRIRVLAPAGSTATAQLEPEQVLAALREVRAEVRGCVERAGGLAALGLTAHGDAADGDAGVPAAPVVTTFAFDDDGRVDPTSLVSDPPLPPALERCWHDTVAAAPFPAGPRGGVVELQMGAPSPRS